MTECAWCATRTKGTYFSERYKRLAARRGKKRALVAIAAEMLKVIYHMIKDGTAYQELGPDYMDDKRKQAQIKYYQDQIKKLTGEDSPGKESAQRRTNPKADYYWDSKPENETGLND